MFVTTRSAFFLCGAPMRRGTWLAGAAVAGWLGISDAAATDCVSTAAEAERAWSIPAGLLLAIGRVESGRYDARSRAVAPWPWTVNAGGQGSTFADAAGAAAHVAGLQQQGVRSIDVGCFQVNLMHHPNAFASLPEAFDPARNADYAARFLASLYGRTGDWPAAAARYHSATPGLADAYRARVLAAWSRSNLDVRLADLGPDAVRPRSNLDAVRPGAPLPGAAVLQDWPRTGQTEAASARPPSRQAPGLALASFGVRVFALGNLGAEPAPRAGLPRVIVPGQSALPVRLARAIGR